MRELVVYPKIGIGLLKLGMTPEQILNAIKNELTSIHVTGEIQISEEKEEDGYTLRYLIKSFFFMVRYKENQAIEISVDRELANIVNITLIDMNVFTTSVEKLINGLKRFYACNYDAKDEQLSITYEFDEIGIRLWREDAFHEKLLLDEEYMKQMSLVIDDMYHYLYFDMITVK